jgi:hypothetical protein
VLTSLWIYFSALWKFIKGKIHVLVYGANVLCKMLPDGGEFTAIDADHTEFIDLAQSAQIEQGKTNDLDT